MKYPWIKFWPRDWQTNKELQTCSLAARGAWIEMMCLMAQSDRYGYLESNGKPMTPEQLATLIRTDPAGIKLLLKELSDAGVTSVCPDTGVAFSRRMVKDARFRDAAIETGKLGGNPALKAGKKRKGKSNTKNPESIVQTPEASKGMTVGDNPTLNPTDNPPVKADFDRFWDAYPRKTGKKAAQKSWDKATDKPDIDAILASIDRQKASDQWTKDGGQYIPHPATWLNQGRWDDQPMMPSNRTPVAPIPYSEKFNELYELYPAGGRCEKPDAWIAWQERLPLIEKAAAGDIDGHLVKCVRRIEAGAKGRSGNVIPKIANAIRRGAFEE